MATLSSLDRRISVLEAEIENMEKTITKIESVIHDNYEGTLAIKQRLDTWNGSIPHLVEDVKELHVMQVELLEAVNKKSIIDAKTSVKLGIMWAAGAAIVGAGFSLVIKLLVP
jgi:chromosome segregation ATPase